MQSTTVTRATAELLDAVGTSLPPTVMRLERGVVKRFAEAVGYRDPLYYDAEYARGTDYGGVIAPQGFFGWPVDRLMPIEEILEAFYCSSGNILNGGSDMEFFAPVRPGDTLVGTRTLRNVSEKEGSIGRMLILEIDTAYQNQDGARVAIDHETFIVY